MFWQRRDEKLLTFKTHQQDKVRAAFPCCPSGLCCKVILSLFLFCSVSKIWYVRFLCCRHMFISRAENDICDKLQTKVRSKHGLLTFSLCCMLPVTAQCILKGNSKQGRANVMAAFSRHRAPLSPVGSQETLSHRHWQGWINEFYLHSTEWVVLEKQQHPFRPLLNAHSILLPQFSKYGWMSWKAWSKYSSELHGPVMQVPFQVFLNMIVRHCRNFQLLTLESELLSVE